MQLINTLRNHLLDAARILARATAETWAEADPKVQSIFTTHVEPIRRDLERRLLHSGSVSLIWSTWVRAQPAAADWTVD